MLKRSCGASGGFQQVLRFPRTAASWRLGPVVTKPGRQKPLSMIARASTADSPAPDPPEALPSSPPVHGPGDVGAEQQQLQAAQTAPGGTQPAVQGLRIERLRVALLEVLSSLDRGLAANAREAEEVDHLCSRLEALGGRVQLQPLAIGGNGAAATAAASTSSGNDVGSGADRLAGTWRLVYSSGFNSGSLGGRRPGPPAALFPTILGQVYQRIDPGSGKLDNIVELLFSYGPPDWGLLGAGEEALGRGLAGLGRQLGLELKAEQLPPPLRGLLSGATRGSGQQQAGQGTQRKRESPAARLTLRHDYEVTNPATVRIVYEETYGELVGSDLFAQLPRLEAPVLPEPLRPPAFLRSASFDVTFLDESLRITRGDRGELRVYLRDRAAEAAVGAGGGAAAAMALDYDD